MAIPPVGAGGITPEASPPLSPKEVARILSDLLGDLIASLQGATTDPERYDIFEKNLPMIQRDTEFAEKTLPPNDPLVKAMENLKQAAEALVKNYYKYDKGYRHPFVQAALEELNEASQIAHKESQ